MDRAHVFPRAQTFASGLGVALLMFSVGPAFAQGEDSPPSGAEPKQAPESPSDAEPDPGTSPKSDDKNGDDKNGDDKNGDDKNGDDKNGDDKDADDKDADNNPPPPKKPPPKKPPPKRKPIPAPKATPVERIGDTRWSDSLGWVSPASSDGARRVSGARALSIPPITSSSENVSLINIGPDMQWLNPTNNDGATEDAGRMGTLHFYFDAYREMRKAGRLVGGFIRGGVGMGGGVRSFTPEGSNTEQTLTLVQMQARISGGLDFGRTFYSVGPFVGAEANLVIADIKVGENDTSTDRPEEGGGVSLPLIYGAHAKLRFGQRQHFIDPAVYIQQGSKVSATYFRMEAALRASDGLYIGALFQQRLSATGSYSVRFNDDDNNDADATNLGEAFAISAPVERRIVLTFGIIVDGLGN